MNSRERKLPLHRTFSWHTMCLDWSTCCLVSWDLFCFFPLGFKTVVYSLAFLGRWLSFWRLGFAGECRLVSDVRTPALGSDFLFIVMLFASNDEATLPIFGGCPGINWFIVFMYSLKITGQWRIMIQFFEKCKLRNTDFLRFHSIVLPALFKGRTLERIDSRN